MRATRTVLLMAGWLGADACGGAMPSPKPAPAPMPVAISGPWRPCHWVQMGPNDTAVAAGTPDTSISLALKAPNDTAHQPLVKCVVLTTVAKDTAHQP